MTLRDAVGLLVRLLEALPKDSREWFAVAAFLETHLDELDDDHRARVERALD